MATETSVAETMSKDDIESLFSDESVDGFERKRADKQSNSATVLKNINWEVKKGEKVGLVGCK